MSTSGDPFDAMIKMFEEKKSILIRKNQELQKLSGAAEISEYKRLANGILRNHTPNNIFYTFVSTNVSNRRGSKAEPDYCIKTYYCTVTRGKE